MLGCLLSGATMSPHFDRTNLDMHSEDLIEPLRRFTQRACTSQVRDAFRGWDRETFETYLDAAIEPIGRYTWTP
jgi:hypothetical protein